MEQDLDRRLAAARERLARWQKLQRVRARQEEERSALQQRVADLTRQLRQEERDVERLEGPGLQAFLAELLGHRDQRLDKERQEAAAARLRYTEAQARLEALEAQYSATTAELETLAAAEAEYEAVLAEKEQWLRSRGGEGAEALMRLAEEEGRLRSLDREIAEAQQAGQAARTELLRVEERMESAQGWGTWDMVGGGMIATAIKHSRLDEAQQAVRAAQHALDRFTRELGDVQTQVHIQGPEIGGFLTFADYFFDGLLTDLMVQQRIRDSLAGVRRTLGEVDAALRGLESRKIHLRRELAALETERRRLLEG